MKTYLVKLRSGSNCEFDAEDEESLRLKLNSGHYSVLPIRGMVTEPVISENVTEIIELKDQGMKK